MAEDDSLYLNAMISSSHRLKDTTRMSSYDFVGILWRRGNIRCVLLAEPEVPHATQLGGRQLGGYKDGGQMLQGVIRRIVQEVCKIRVRVRLSRGERKCSSCISQALDVASVQSHIPKVLKRV